MPISRRPKPARRDACADLSRAFNADKRRISPVVPFHKERIHIGRAAKVTVLPATPEIATIGAINKVVGIAGCICGMKYNWAVGTTVSRPLALARQDG